MPSPTTALDLITRSMKLAKVLAAGETPTAEEAVDALATLNDILENWDTEPMSLWSSANDVVPLVPGQATYTIGPGGNFNISRPRKIDGAYVTANGVDFTLNVIGQAEYDLILIKTLQGIPGQLLYVNDMPLGLVTVFPVPSEALTMTINASRVLTQIPSTVTAINYPPGAAKALRYALAIELAVEYGSPLDPVILAIATDAKADYKRANTQPTKSSFDGGLLSMGR